MIFGSKKNDAMTNQVLNLVRPVIDRVSTQHGLPLGFWKDEYSLGFLMGQINSHMADLGGDKLSVADRGKVLVDSYAELSGEKGKPIAELAMVFAMKEDSAFTRANQNGMFIAKYVGGTLPDVDRQPVILAMKAELESTGEEVSEKSVTDLLYRRHWVDELRTRFMVGA